MRFEYKHIHKSGLAMMKMTHNSNIPDILGECGCVQEEAFWETETVSTKTLETILRSLTPCRNGSLVGPSLPLSIFEL